MGRQSHYRQRTVWKRSRLRCDRGSSSMVEARARVCVCAAASAAVWEPKWVWSRQLEREDLCLKQRVCIRWEGRGVHPGFPWSCSPGKRNVTRFCLFLAYPIGSALLLYLVSSFRYIFFLEDAETGKKSEADYVGNRHFEITRCVVGISQINSEKVDLMQRFLFKKKCSLNAETQELYVDRRMAK